MRHTDNNPKAKELVAALRTAGSWLTWYGLSIDSYEFTKTRNPLAMQCVASDESSVI